MEHGLKFENTKMRLTLCVWQYTESVAAQTSFFVRENVAHLWRSDDLMMFKSLTLTQFCLVKNSVGKMLF